MRNPIAVFTFLVMTTASFAEDTLESRKFADCDFIQTAEFLKTTPVPFEATAGCETGGGGTKSCLAGVYPTQPNFRIDPTQSKAPPIGCRKIEGDNPCAFVQAGPVIFNADGTASRTFTTDSDRVLVWATLSQISVEKSYSDKPAEHLTLYRGNQFSVAVEKTASSARFKCALVNGDQDIYPINGDKDLSKVITFVGKVITDPVFNVVSYRVAK